MRGRRDLRGTGATTLSIVALIVVLALVFVPSMGPGAVPAGLVASASPAGAVVHLLGDEVVAAARPVGNEVRARSLLAGDPAVATLAMVALLAAVLAAGWVIGPARTGPIPVVARTGRSGRSPPRRIATR